MNKPLILILVLLLVAAGVYFIVDRQGRGDAGDGHDTAELLPAETALLLSLPDMEGSARRWQSTALAAIHAEPSVQEFLEKPLERLHAFVEGQGWLNPLLALDCSGAFVAFMELDEQVPTVVGGLRTSASREVIDAALRPAVEAMQEKFPAGRADIADYGGIRIDSYDTGKYTVFSAIHGGYYLVSSDRSVLEGVLDRIGGGAAGTQADAEPVLAETDKYLRAVARLPKVRESLVFLDMAPVVGKIEALAMASGQPVDKEQMAEMKRVVSLAASTTFEGANLRDTLFVLAPDEKAVGPIVNEGLRYTTPDTIFHYAALFLPPDTLRLPDPSMDTTGFVYPLRNILQQLSDKGIGFERLDEAFGPEFSLKVDWPDNSAQPSVLASLGVRDRELAGRYVHEFVSGSLGLPAWGEQQNGDGRTLYLFPSLGHLQFTPAICLTSDALFVSASVARIQEAFEAGAGTGALGEKPSFRTAMDTVAPAGTAMAYLDTRELFQRAYTMLRPILLFSSAMMPGVSDSVDFSKLPETETVTQHLTPTVFTQSMDSDGYLYDSVGAITMGQFFLGGTTSAVLVALQFQGLLGS